MKKVKLRPFANKICDLFEDLLDEHNIDIPNDEREGDEEEAHLYGSDYYSLEDAVVEILTKFASEIDPNCNVELVDEF